MDTKWKPYFLLTIATVLVIGSVLVIHKSLSGVPTLPPVTLHNTTITNSMVVEKIQKVAKVVSSEVTVRDVVTYENTWYGSTKRTLVVVTGKIMGGINLDAGYDVRIDEKAKRISITLPKATILAVEIGEMKTYDEQGGLWNPITAADRDAIFKQARTQFEQSGQTLKITEKAQTGAKELFEAMFSNQGYGVEVSFR